MFIKKVLLIQALLLIVLLKICGQYTLEIEITGIKNNKGFIMLQLFDEHGNIAGQERGVIKGNKSMITFRDLKQGKYAFRFFHDENLSGVMETNSLGIPREGYGFSNNASGVFGPRPFREWLFILENDKKAVVKTIN